MSTFDLQELIDLIEAEKEIKFDDPESKKNNLEYDLITSSVIKEKCQDKVYAQHLYAALCNNDFVKNDILPLLKEEHWNCSWRYAGGIIADIIGKGDYIDWYCSGMFHSTPADEEFINELSLEEQITTKENNAFVGEGVVTEEIKKDLFDLGWLVVQQ